MPALHAPDHKALVEFLDSRDEECPVCSYSLRGLKSPVCPECAAELHLQVGSANLHPGPWILAVASFALGLGFDGVVSLLMTIGFIVALIRVGPPKSIGEAWPAIVFYTTFLTLSAASATGFTFVVRRRRAWNRLPHRTQRRAAALIFVGVGALHAAVGGTLFAIFAK